jgi:hypothetical protein
MDKNSFKMKIRAIFCFFALANTWVYTMENNKQLLNQKGIIGNMLAFIATSKAMHCYNQFCAKIIPLQGTPAPEAVQVLGKEAQIAVGIPADRHVPIQYIPELNCSAVAGVNAIIIGNEFINDETAYGVKRCNMFHEAVHIKYHDDMFNGILFPCSLLGAPLATKMLVKPEGKLKLLYLPALVIGHYAGRAIQGKFENYRERRADIEGHYATQCYKCVTEKTEDIRGTYELAHDIIIRLDHKTDLNEAQVHGLAYAKNWIESKKQYLSIEENETIAAELKRDNKVCLFHEQSR